MSYRVNDQLIERVVGTGTIEDFKGKTFDQIVEILTRVNEDWKYGGDDGLTEDEINEAAADLEYLNRIESLMELTGQESGIVIYGDEIIVANWSSICPNGGLPMMAPANLGLIAWPKEIIVVNDYWVDDIRQALPGSVVESGTDDDGNTLLDLDGMAIIADENGDICALYGYDIGAGATINRDEDGNLMPTAGKVYELADGEIVIAPDGWC